MEKAKGWSRGGGGYHIYIYIYVYILMCRSKVCSSGLQQWGCRCFAATALCADDASAGSTVTQCVFWAALAPTFGASEAQWYPFFSFELPGSFILAIHQSEKGCACCKMVS